MLAYFIPGSDGAVAAGSRCLNWVWYVHVGLADLTNVLTDKNGARHRSSLLPGTTPERAVADLRARALREIHPKMAALVSETRDPLLQTILDVTVPKTLFGRILLTGDAAFVVRPHTAGGTSKAAYEASVLAHVAIQSTEHSSWSMATPSTNTASRSAIAGRVNEAPISPISWRPVRTDRRENR
jgi:2-polyprenyl-6-methoxyphenol hydroxylase-like FAD-dependent oxidoreductase